MQSRPNEHARVRKGPADPAEGFHDREHSMWGPIKCWMEHIFMFIEGRSEPIDVGARESAPGAPAGAASPFIADHHQDCRMTRRSVFIGAVAALICAPAIARTTSLMPVPGRQLPLLNPLGEFYRYRFYRALEIDLKEGRSMSTVIDGKIVSVIEGRRMVAHARAQGWLSPEAA